MFGNKKKDEPSTDIDYQKTIDALNEEIESYQQTIATFPGAKQHWEAELQTVKKNYEGQIDDLKKQLAAKEYEVNIKVQSSLIAIGANGRFSPQQISIPSNIHSDQAILDKWQSLSGNEKGEYYTEHAVEIARATLLLTQSPG